MSPILNLPRLDPADVQVRFAEFLRIATWNRAVAVETCPCRRPGRRSRRRTACGRAHWASSPGDSRFHCGAALQDRFIRSSVQAIVAAELLSESSVSGPRRSTPNCSPRVPARAALPSPSQIRPGRWRARARADVGGEIHGKTVGVVELEDGFAGNRLAVELADRALEQRHTFSASRRNAPLPVATRARHGRRPFAAPDMPRPFPARALSRACGRMASPCRAVAVADRAADDPAQHVAAAVVAGHHAVGDQECAGAHVIGDNAQRRARSSFWCVASAAERSGSRTGRCRSWSARPA